MTLSRSAALVSLGLTPLVVTAADAPAREMSVEGAASGERSSPAALRGASGKQSWSVDLVKLPGGRFTFGPLPGEGDPKQPAAREVTVTPFWMADVETPWGLFERLCDPAARASWPSPDWTCPTAGESGGKPLQRADLPVVNVTWWDAIAFCNWLTLQELGADQQVYVVTGTGDARVVTVHLDRSGYRLPTEEEWEWAARAGRIDQAYAGYANPGWGCDFANTPFTGCARGTADTFAAVAPARPPASGAGAFKPNTWGMYQMSGNVQEWTTSTAPDATGAASLRVLRGGSWDLGPVVVNASDEANRRTIDAGHVTYRLVDLPTRARPDGGFRLARSL